MTLNTAAFYRMESTELNYLSPSMEFRRRRGLRSAALCAGMLALLSLPALAGTLRLGPPVVQDNQYRFPVYLQGNADGVAALDFRLSYDPAVFSPVSAQSGTSAVSAQKQVSSNVSAPGEFVVVMMGFNQNVVQPGEVVELVLEKIGEPAGGQSELLIAEPTMATYEGVEIDSSGLARVVRFDEDKSEGEDTEAEVPAENDQDTTEGEVEVADPGPETNDPNSVRQPAGNLQLVAANSAAGDTTKSAAGTAPGEASQNVSAPVAGTPAMQAAGTPIDALPPGTLAPDSTEDAAHNDATGGRPLPAGAGPAGTGQSTGPDAVQDGDGQSTRLETPAPKVESGKSSTLFVTLALVAIAIPLAALLALKVLR